MNKKLKQLIAGSMCGALLATGFVMAATDCAFSKASANTGPCAVVSVCGSNVPYYDGTSGWLCNPAKTFPPSIHKDCVNSPSERNNCNGSLMSCYRTTTCEAYQVTTSPPTYKCRDLTASGDWTNAESKSTVSCDPPPPPPQP